MQKQSNPKRIAPRVFFIRAKNNELSYYTFAHDLEDLYGYLEQQVTEPLDWSSLLEDGDAMLEVIKLHKKYREKTNHEKEFSPHVVYLDRKNSPLVMK
jgi:hypothetical protein